MRAGTVYLIDSVMTRDESRITIVCVCLSLRRRSFRRKRKSAAAARARRVNQISTKKEKKKRKKINKYVNRLFLDCVRAPSAAAAAHVLFPMQGRVRRRRRRAVDSHVAFSFLGC